MGLVLACSCLQVVQRREENVQQQSHVGEAHPAEAQHGRGQPGQTDGIYRYRYICILYRYNICILI